MNVEKCFSASCHRNEMVDFEQTNNEPSDSWKMGGIYYILVFDYILRVICGC